MSKFSIETEYYGTTYRSRTEARWAVLFDVAGIGFQYEPEGYKLESGWYVPDFQISGWNCFLEVKGSAPTQKEFWLAEDLAMHVVVPVYMAVGNPARDMHLIKIKPDRICYDLVPVTELVDERYVNMAQKHRFDWSIRSSHRAAEARRMIRTTAAVLSAPFDEKPIRENGVSPIIVMERLAIRNGL